MSTFIYTPTNVDDYDWLFRNPANGKWTIPKLVFNPLVVNPYYQVDPLNEDVGYQNKVIDHFYTRLTEKWLYSDPTFKGLLKYFKVKKNGEKGSVMLISKPSDASESNVSEDDKKHVFRYIEKYFITERFVSKIIREYVSTTRIKWYDLYNNSRTVKDLLRHKLKKQIISTIYKLEK